MTPVPQHPGARGVALLNATVVILLVAALATQLLGRSTDIAQRLRMANTSNQLTLFLDAAAVLVPEILSEALGPRRSFAATAEWYRDTYEFPVLDGTIGGQLYDLQAGFNLAWLRDADDTGAEAAFARLWLDLGLPQDKLAPFLATLRTRDTGSDIVLSRWTGLPPPGTAGLTAAEQTRLAPYVVDLPADVGVNLNTGELAVIHAFLPQIDRDDLTAVLRIRDSEGITSALEFRYRLAAYLDQETLAGVNFDRFDGGTDWFEVRLIAQRGADTARSRLVLQRQGDRFVAVGIYSVPGGVP